MKMDRIDSFCVNHDLLSPGIYISRIDKVGRYKVTTFDIRCKKPNNNDFMSLEAMHTIEHLGATFFRNNADWKDKVLYFGPMGCATGFYLILVGDYKLYSPSHKKVIEFILDMFDFVAKFKGKIPGSSKIECGNYKSHNLEEARNIAGNMAVLGRDFMMLEFEYKTGDLLKDNEIHKREEVFINRPKDRKIEEEARKRGFDIKRFKEEHSNIFNRENVEISKISPAERYDNDHVSFKEKVPEILQPAMPEKQSGLF